MYYDYSVSRKQSTLFYGYHSSFFLPIMHRPCIFLTVMHPSSNPLHFNTKRKYNLSHLHNFILHVSPHPHPSYLVQPPLTASFQPRKTIPSPLSTFPLFSLPSILFCFSQFITTYHTILPPFLLPAFPQVKQLIIAMKTAAMPLTIAVRMLAMALTMAVRQPPIARKIDSNCVCGGGC